MKKSDTTPTGPSTEDRAFIEAISEAYRPRVMSDHAADRFDARVLERARGEGRPRSRWTWMILSPAAAAIIAVVAWLAWSPAPTELTGPGQGSQLVEMMTSEAAQDDPMDEAAEAFAMLYMDDDEGLVGEEDLPDDYQVLLQAAFPDVD